MPQKTMKSKLDEERKDLAESENVHGRDDSMRSKKNWKVRMLQSDMQGSRFRMEPLLMMLKSRVQP